MANVELDIQINTSGDVTGIRKAEDALKDGKTAAENYEKQLEAVKDAQSKLAVGAAAMGAAVVGAFAGAVVTAADYGDEIAKASKRTGIATEDLSALRYAAEQSDVTFEQLGTGLARMSRTMTETSWGTGQAAQAYAELGVEVTDASGNLRGTQEVFIDIAEGLTKIEDPAKRAALAMMIFGRGGVQLMPLLMEGGKGVEYLTDRAEQLGLVMGAETAAAAERFNDSVADIKYSLKGLVVTVGETAFGTAELNEKIAESVGEFGDWLRDNQKMVEVLAKVGVALATVTTGLYAATKAFGLAKETVGMARTILTWYTAKVGANTAAITTETAALGANTTAQIANAAAARGAGAARGGAAAVRVGAGAASAAGGASISSMMAAAVPAVMAALPAIAVVVASLVAAYFIKKDVEVVQDINREYNAAVDGMNESVELLGKETLDTSWKLRHYGELAGHLVTFNAQGVIGMIGKSKREAVEKAAAEPITREEARGALRKKFGDETPKEKIQREQREAAAAATTAAVPQAVAETVAEAAVDEAVPKSLALARAGGVPTTGVHVDPSMLQVEVILKGEGPLLERIARSSEVRASIHNATMNRQRMAFGEA